MSDIPTLCMCVNDNELYDISKNKVEAHNNNVKNNQFPDSGFDLFVPMNYDIKRDKVTFVDMQVKTMMEKNGVCVGFHLYARSSMSKMPIMLANHVGIIDSGYRGNIIAAVRGIEDCVVEKSMRIVQICHPSLCPFFVKLANEDELVASERGSRGFGSSGR